MTRLFAFIFTFGFGFSALAQEPRALTMTDYLGGDVRTGDVICDVIQLEPGQMRCYLTFNPFPALTPDNDPSNALGCWVVRSVPRTKRSNGNSNSG